MRIIQSSYVYPEPIFNMLPYLFYYSLSVYTLLCGVFLFVCFFFSLLGIAVPEKVVSKEEWNLPSEIAFLFVPFLCFLRLLLLPSSAARSPWTLSSIELVLSPFSSWLVTSSCLSSRQWPQNSVSRTSDRLGVVCLTRQEWCYPLFTPSLVHLFSQSISTVSLKVSTFKTYLPGGHLAGVC